MPTRPVVPYQEWASGSTPNVNEAPPAVRETGFGSGDPVREDYLNFDMRLTWLVLGWLLDVFPSSDELRVGRIVGIGDPGGAPGGPGNRLFIYAAAGDVQVASGSGDAVLRSLSGVVVLNAPGGDVDLDAQGLELDLTGSWAGTIGGTVSLTVTGGVVSFNGAIIRGDGHGYTGAAKTWDQPAEARVLVDDGGLTFTRQRPLGEAGWKVTASAGGTAIWEELLTCFPEVSGDAAYTITGIQGQLYRENIGDNVTLSVIERPIGNPSVEYTIATVNILSGTGTWQTRTGNGSLVLAPAANRYYVRIVTTFGAARRVGWGQLTVLCNKTAVE